VAVLPWRPRVRGKWVVGALAPTLASPEMLSQGPRLPMRGRGLDAGRLEAGRSRCWHTCRSSCGVRS